MSAASTRTQRLALGRHARREYSHATTRTMVYMATGEAVNKNAPQAVSYPPPAVGSPMPDSADPDPLIDTRLDDTYEIVRGLAAGGMGRVYEARHHRIRTKRLAVKVIHANLAGNPEIVSRFQREVEAAAAISSPYVASVYDVGRTRDGRPYLVAEFLQGMDLGESLERHGKLPVGFSVRIVRQVCRGLAAAHDSGVVHRDIKPENVFLTGDLNRPLVKVLDFGVSRLDDGQAKKLTEAGAVLGTPAFMPPEQAQGARVDHRADIYSAGALLYTALTGQDPFVGETTAEILFAVLTREPVGPRTLEPSIPMALEALIQRAMAKDPADRFPSIAALADALAPYDPDEGVSIELPGRAQTQIAQTGPADRETTARTARLRLAALSVVGSLWVWLVGSTLAAATLRALWGTGTQPSGREMALLMCVVLAALVTPTIIVGRRLRTEVWPNTARVLKLADRLRLPVLATLATYGGCALLIRVVGHLVGDPDAASASSTSNFWLVVLSTGVGVGLWFAPKFGEPLALALRLVEGLRPVRRLAQGLRPWLRGTRQRVVAGGFAAMAALGLVAAGWCVSRPPSTPPAAADGSDGGDTSDPSANEPVLAGAQAIDRARAGGVEPLETLAAQFPQDPAVARALALSRASIVPPDLVGALSALQGAVALDAKLANDVALIELVRTASLGSAAERDQAARVMATHMGARGADLAYESWVAEDAFSRQAETLLSNAEFRAGGSPALQVAWDLRQASSCADKAELLARAKQHGDRRAVVELRRVSKRRPRGCGFLGSRACPPVCRQHAKAMTATIAAIESRGQAEPGRTDKGSKTRVER
ncbi:MAG: serine/threonine protein kinase [Myxococcales bacterium FL481]|nr:MAG: serine/threonine protein kinase [Myxococcales bacterium FL481]